MNSKERLEYRIEEIKGKLFSVKIPKRKESSICWEIGRNLGVTGTTIQNYLKGRIGDGYLAEAIYDEFEKLEMVI